MLDTFFFFFVREVEVGLCFVKNTEVFLVLFLCQVYKATGEEFLKIAGGQIPVFFFVFFFPFSLFFIFPPCLYWNVMKLSVFGFCLC